MTPICNKNVYFPSFSNTDTYTSWFFFCDGIGILRYFPPYTSAQLELYNSNSLSEVTDSVSSAQMLSSYRLFSFDLRGIPLLCARKFSINHFLSVTTTTVAKLSLHWIHKYCDRWKSPPGFQCYSTLNVMPLIYVSTLKLYMISRTFFSFLNTPYWNSNLFHI